MKFRNVFHFSTLPALIFACLMLTGLVRPAAAAVMPAAQTQAITLKNVRVQIWPEYDKPSVLVIYNVTLPASVALPANVSLRIPAAVGKPNAVAWQSTDNALYEIKYDTAAAGDWIEVKFSTPASDFRVEYYDPTLAKDGAKRSFTFRWPGDYAAENFAIEVQQPKDATGMTLTPTAGPGQVSSSDGLTYYNLLAGKVNAGTTFALSMTYNKPSDALTVASQYQPAKANQPVSTATGRVSMDQMLPWIIAGVGVLLIAAGLFWYYRSGRVGYGKPPRARHAARAAAAGSSSAVLEEGDSVFCTQCGKRAAPGDTFCRACGTKLNQ